MVYIAMERRDKKGRFLPVHSGFAGVKPIKIRRLVEYYRSGFISDSGGIDRIPIAKLILIDRTCSLLGIILCFEDHIRKNFIMEGLEVLPLLRDHYTRYVGILERHLKLIGFDLEDLPPLELSTIIKEVKLEKVSKRKKAK